MWRNTAHTKEVFYSELNLEGISDADYPQVQKVWEVFEIKNWGEYHNLYAQSDTLLLADVFENFRNMCLKEYGLDPASFLTAAGSRIRIINRYWYAIDGWRWN